MALVKLIMQSQPPCLAARCRFQTMHISLLSPNMGRAFSKTALHQLSATVSGTQNVPAFSAMLRNRLFSRLLGSTFNKAQALRYVHQTFLVQAKNKLPFEVDSNVRRDTLIFSYRNDTLFKMITLFGITQFFFWIYMAFVTDMTLKQFNFEDLKKQKASFSQTVIMLLKDYSTKISGACILLGNVVLFFTVLYPKRSVRTLTLLKGGKNVKLATYTYFGKTTQFTVPLEEVSGMQSRDSKGATLAMKIKGHWFYYMLDKRKGIFHQPELFDHVVGLQRDFK